MASEQRAVCLRIDDAAILARLRRRSGIEVCEHQDAIWLRIQVVTEELDADLRTLPGQRFTVMRDGQLVRFGRLVPKGYLPENHWMDLSEWMIVQTDPAALGGKVTNRINLRIVRGGTVQDTNVIVTSVDEWKDFALNASQVRLDQWAFALNDNDHVVVRGTPLPPVMGTRFVERSGVAIEAGWICSPPLAPEVLSRVLGLQSEDVALLHADGTWDHIQGDDFVRCTRSAIRLSLEALANG